MKTTGEFTSHTFPIKFKSSTKPITLIPFGDIHYGNPHHCEATFERFIEFCKSVENPYYFGMGDYLEVASTSERKILNSGLHESTVSIHDKWHTDLTLELAHRLNFMKGRIIGMLGGNHYYQFSTGQTSDHILCDQLECRYLGVMSVTRLKLKIGEKKKTLDICAHHGTGGGKRTGSSVNNVEDLRNVAVADIYLMGHDHKKWIAPGSVLQWNSSSGELEARDIMYGRTGSFVLGHLNERKSYVTDSGRGPVPLGWISIDVSLTERTLPNRKKRLVLDLCGRA